MNRNRLLVCILILLTTQPQSMLRAQTSGEPPANAAQTARSQKIARAAESLRAQLIAQRRDFHAHPELSNREERTSRVVAERLKALGLDDVKTGVGKYGVVALLKGGKPGPVIAVRADMDALPIQETIDVPYKSLNPGVKHACGHDVHTSVQLGVAEVLSRMREDIRGTIKFIFQPAEEGPPAGEEGGAALMIKEGVLENPRPRAIFGLHTMPTLEIGEVSHTSGPMMASADRFTATIRGKQSHGAQPHNGIDSVVVAAECVLALQHIRSRRIDPMEPLVISVGIIQGGTRSNILAGEVKLEGTMRTLSEEVRERAKALMKETLANTTATYGASFDLQFQENAAVTFNDPPLVAETLPIMRQVLGEKKVLARPPQMVAEDFSYFQRVIPGFFYYLGVGNRAKGITAMLHTAEYDVDEESLVIGVNLMSNVLLDYLDRHAGEASKNERATVKQSEEKK
ncbi:MAG: amidohydrolase [Pyrinomonadaceae bacterium]|nr:amidohydrolase [Pyrinomonadaceae bacterium]